MDLELKLSYVNLV